MLTSIQLNGFKGQFRQYLLSGPTLIAGHNGAGKSSCLEGIIYALTGKVPGGSSSDTVAQFFPQRGGTVTLHAGDNWITRGIEKDAKKKVVSEVLDSSVQTSDGKVDTGYWMAQEEVLNVRNLLSMSPAKLREYLLTLCGGGDGSGDVLGAVAIRYAHMVAGKAANELTLKDPSVLDDEELASMCCEWTRPRGIRDCLEASKPRGEISLSQVFLKFGERAKEERLSAQRTVRDTEAALRELEAEVQGASAAARDLDRISAEVAFQRDVVAESRDHEQRWREARGTLLDANNRIELRKNALSEAVAASEVAVDPGAMPVAAPSTYTEEMYNECVRKHDSLRDVIQSFDKSKYALSLQEIANARTKKVLDKLEADPRNILGKRMGAIPDDVHPLIPALRNAVNDVLHSWAKEHGAAATELTNGEATRLEFVSRVEDDEVQRPAIRKEMAELDDLMAKWRSETNSTTQNHMLRVKAWKDKADAWNEAHGRVGREQAALNAAEQARQDAEDRCNALSEIKMPEKPELTLLELEKKLANAAEAAGSLKAHRDAAKRCIEATLSVTCWKVAEKAIDQAREELVSMATRPIIESMDKVLAMVGRDERAYAELENDRGRPICQLGWQNGTRTPVGSLSAGETVIFTVALTMAIAANSRGLKVMLVEADPLDDVNLFRFLDGALAIGSDLDALIVATASHVQMVPKGWNVINL